MARSLKDFPGFNIGTAAIIVTVVCILMLIFSGYMVDLRTMKEWLSWLQWISACRYASNVLVINEFRNLQFCSSETYEHCPLNGSTILDRYSLVYVSDWDLWKYLFMLICMILFLFGLALLSIYRIKKK